MTDLDKFDLERIAKFEKIVAGVYKREMNSSNPNLRSFSARLSGDTAPFYADEIKIPRIRAELRAIVEKYRNLISEGCQDAKRIYTQNKRRSYKLTCYRQFDRRITDKGSQVLQNGQCYLSRYM
jgi:hypothetical protein